MAKKKKGREAHWLIQELESGGEARLFLVVEGQEHPVFDFPDYLSAYASLDELNVHMRFKKRKKK